MKRQPSVDCSYLSILLTLLVILGGCGTVSPSDRTSLETTIRIGETIDPMVYRARFGEEVLLQNMRPTPIRIGILSATVPYEFGCGTFLSSWWGGATTMVTIPPGELLRLCIRRPGVLQYNVWFDLDDPRGTISPTAKIRILPKS